MFFNEPFSKPGYLLASMAKRFALLPRSFRLTCAELVTGSPACQIFYLGEGASLPYFREILTGSAAPSPVSRVPFWHLAATIRRLASPDTLLILELNRLLAPLVPAGSLVTYPWLRQRVALDGPEYQRRRQGIEADFGRKVRKYRYQFRIVHDCAALKHFYETLYVPHTTARFGNVSHLRSRGEMQKWLASGFLLQVFQDDSWVSGAVVRADKEQLAILALGHLADEQYPLRYGALSAIYYYLFGYAAEQGLARVDLLRSRPHARDGVYRHKLRWGAVPHKDSWPHTAIRVFSPAGLVMPKELAGLLVWDGGRFAEIGDFLQQQGDVNPSPLQAVP